MNIRIKIIENDTDNVAKIVLVDNEGRVLLLKRAPHLDKFAKEWDLPGGHIKENESLMAGLRREVQEESGLNINKAVFFTQTENHSFFYSKYDSEPIVLSDEHTEYKFFPKSELDKNDKFQKLAINALERFHRG